MNKSTRAAIVGYIRDMLPEPEEILEEVDAAADAYDEGEFSYEDLEGFINSLEISYDEE